MPEYVTYFDEVKPNPAQGETRYIVGGLSIPLSQVSTLESQCNDLAQATFGSRQLTEQTEFHATKIYSGRGAFKGRPPSERIKLLGDLGLVFAQAEGVKKVYASIDTSKLKFGVDPARMAFAFFCERVQMVARGGCSLLIGDSDDKASRQMIREFSEYRATGTPWGYGIEIPNLIDAVHFAHSHHSRMIQLADVYLFLSSHSGSGRSGWMAEALSKEMNDREISLWPDRYKDWPPS